MKKLIFLIFSIFLYSCELEQDNKVKYQYAISSYVPDSNKQKFTDYIVNVTKAASFHMSTSDYEHPDRLIYEAGRQAACLYEEDIEGLSVTTGPYMFRFIPEYKLDKRQKQIFIKLKSENEKN